MRIFLLYLMVYTYVLLGAYSYASNLPAGVLKAEQATYKVVIMFNENKGDFYGTIGTGFFIAPYRFVTNLHVIDDLENIEDVSLVRDDKPFIKVKKLLSISAYADLAILQTEQKSDIYLSKGEKSLFHEGVFAIGYPGGTRRPVTIRSVGEVHTRDNIYYGAFFELGFVEDVSGMSGSPLLDSKGNLLGILYSVSTLAPYVRSTLSSYLKELSDNHIGTVCGNQPRKCIDHEILKAKKLITQQIDSNYLIPKEERTFFHLSMNAFERFLVSKEDTVRYLSKGAELNHLDALIQLGLMYDLGEGVEQDYEKTISYYERAANRGHSDALFVLGTMYDNGERVEQDLKKSFSYYERAAKMNHPPALYNVGLMYHEGQGVEQDVEKAISYYERAVNMGYLIALSNLGVMYSKGEGVEQDFEKAVSYFERVENMNVPDALLNLGFMYYNGKGVEKDLKKSFSYYERVANMNDPDALFILGVMYSRGEGVKQDPKKAISYFKRAANVNHPDALFVLKSLDRQ